MHNKAMLLPIPHALDNKKIKITQLRPQCSNFGNLKIKGSKQLCCDVLQFTAIF